MGFRGCRSRGSASSRTSLEEDFTFVVNSQLTCSFSNPEIALRIYLCLIIIEVEIYLDVAQGHMKGAPNETRTHSCRFASRAC